MANDYSRMTKINRSGSVHESETTAGCLGISWAVVGCAGSSQIADLTPLDVQPAWLQHSGVVVGDGGPASTVWGPASMIQIFELRGPDSLQCSFWTADVVCP